jgi:hypothetical protein
MKGFLNGIPAESVLSVVSGTLLFIMQMVNLFKRLVDVLFRNCYYSKRVPDSGDRKDIICSIA